MLDPKYLAELARIDKTLANRVRRETIATACLQGRLANSAFEPDYADAAKDAVGYADALIEELNK